MEIICKFCDVKFFTITDFLSHKPTKECLIQIKSEDKQLFDTFELAEYLRNQILLINNKNLIKINETLKNKNEKLKNKNKKSAEWAEKFLQENKELCECMKNLSELVKEYQHTILFLKEKCEFLENERNELKKERDDFYNEFKNMAIFKKFKKKVYIKKQLKIEIWNKYIGIKCGEIKCPYCKTNIINQFNFDSAHIIASSKGGLETLENLVPICGPCNKSIGINELDMKKWNEGLQYVKTSIKDDIKNN